MPEANFELPVYLIHNNIPIYQTYKNDWYENGPYQYHYAVVPYPNEKEESFDIRELSSFDKTLSIDANLRKAIDEKTLPIFRLPEEEQKQYFYDEYLNYIPTTPEQEDCYVIADAFLTKILNSDSGDAFVVPGRDNAFNKTLFLIPDSNINTNSGYSLFIFDETVSWNHFYENEAAHKIFIDNYPADLIQAIFIAMDVEYPMNPEQYLIPDDEIMANPQYAKDSVEVYLWTSDYLSNRAIYQVLAENKDLEAEDIYDFNFYGYYNAQDQSVKVEGTYFIDVNGEEQIHFTLPLYPFEESALKKIIDQYCLTREGQTALELVNAYRKEENLPPIEPLKIPEIDMEKLQSYLKEDMIMEFDSVEECLNYFNTYDGQNFKSTDELKAYQKEYGFSIGEKWYHISFDDALDVYKTDKNPSLKTMVEDAADRTSANVSVPKLKQEIERE